MADEESKTILSKTWARLLEPINKAGYMNGAADGQTATFQPSFDTGYSQGLEFGIQCGIIDASNRLTNNGCEAIQDQSKNLNCQICLNGTTVPQQNIVNLYNIQKEKNESIH